MIGRKHKNYNKNSEEYSPKVVVCGGSHIGDAGIAPPIVQFLSVLVTIVANRHS